MDFHEEERNELAEDEEKLQLALQEVANENDGWLDYDYDDDEDEEEDDALLIDLEAPSSFTGQSTSSGYVESGPRGHFMTIDEGVGPAPSINVPSQLRPETFTAEKTLALNQALQEILESRVESIQMALEINKEKQSRLNDGAWAELESKKPGKGQTWGPFRAPFFKSNEAASFPQDNEDTIMKRNTNELHYDQMREHTSYTSGTKKVLLQAIAEDTRERLMKPIMNRLEAEIKKATEMRQMADEKWDDLQVLRKRRKSLNQSRFEMMERRKRVAAEELEENEEEMNDVEREITKEEEEHGRLMRLKKRQDSVVLGIEDELGRVRHDSDNQILGRVDTSKVDWMKLSKSWFKDSTSWLDCQKAWDFMVNPRINTKAWNLQEEERLLDLVKEYGASQWDVIAKELGTCRTPFHCFNHYQNKFNPEFRARAWTPEEDDKLIDAVKRVRETSHMFTWGKVSTLINCRSSVECRLRYNRIGKDRNFGRWNRSEDSRLVMAVGVLGENWVKVSKFMGNRTSQQCKLRYTQCLSPDLNFFHFTYEDDQKLLLLHKQLGKQWVKIAEQFKGRTDLMIKGRFRMLEKWKKETEWWTSLDDISKNLLLGRNLTIPERKQFEGEWQAFYNKKLGIADMDYKRQTHDKMSGVDPDLIPGRPPIYLKYSKLRRGFATRTHATWSKRLNLHHRLLENLKKRFELERTHEKNATQTDKRTNAIKKVFKNNLLKDDDLTEEEKRMREIMDHTLVDTSTQASGKPIPAETMNSMLSALNLHFLGESNVKVSDLIKTTSQNTRMESVKAAAAHRKKINLRLRKILAKNKWIYTKQHKRRTMRMIPVDTRTSLEIEQDGQEWDKFVPSLLMRRLGGDSFTLMKSIKEKIATAHRKKKKMPRFEDDKVYKSRIHNQKRKINQVRNLLHLPKTERDRLEAIANRKIKTTAKEFSKSYDLKMELLNGVIEDGEMDSDYVGSAEKNNFLHAEEQINEASSSVSKLPDKHSSTSLPKSASAFREKATAMLGDLDEIRADGEVTYSSINYLPPSLYTLTALRSLLLHRQQLMKMAGKLYNPDHYKRKRARQLHIILESDDEENNGGEGGASNAKKTKMDSQANVTAFELAGGQGEEIGKNGNDVNEGNCASSWFKCPVKGSIYEEIYENDGGMDEELDKRGNLPSTSFAPYSVSSKNNHNNNNTNKSLNSVKLEDVEEVDEKEIEIGKIPQAQPVLLEEPIAPSNYEVVVGPALANSNARFMESVSEHKQSCLGKEVVRALENLKETKENEKFENVVVVGLSKGKNEIVHYEAGEFVPKMIGETAGGENGALGGDKSGNAGCITSNEERKTNSDSVMMSGKSKSQPFVIDDDNEDEDMNLNVTNYDTAKNLSARLESNLKKTKQSSGKQRRSRTKAEESEESVETVPVVVVDQSSKLLNDSMRYRDATPAEVKERLARMPHLMDGMIRKARSMEENVVVVGLDPSNGKVIHHHKGEEPPALVVPIESSTSCPQYPRRPEDMSQDEVKAQMAKIRETDEYQRLLARFRSLFMWPVLMSTTKPGSEVNLTNVKVPPPPERTNLTRRGRPKKSEKKKKQTVEVKKPTDGLQYSRRRIDYSKVLPKSVRPKRQATSKHPYNTANTDLTENARLQRLKKKSYMPAWWKEAVTEVMLKKKEIDKGQEDKGEVDINEDDDFVDKGDYSDDEWLAELKEEEAKKEEEERRRQEEMTMKTTKMVGSVEREGLAESVDDGDNDDDDDDDNNGDESEKGGQDVGGDASVQDAVMEDDVTFYVTGEDGTQQAVRLEVIE